MTIQALKRVMWRIRNPTGKTTKKKLEQAIMKECGIWDKTIKTNTQALIRLGWIKRQRGTTIRITGRDEDESV